MGSFRRTCLSVVILLLVSQITFQQYTKLNIGEPLASTQLEFLDRKHLEMPISSDIMTQIRSGSKAIYITLDTFKGGATYTVFGRDPVEGVPVDSGRTTTMTGQTAANQTILLIITSTSPVWHDLQASSKLYIRLQTEVAGVQSVILVGGMASASAYLPMGKRYRADVEGVDKLVFRTSVVRAQANHHYKFLLDALTHKGVTRLTGFGVKGDKTPTPETKQFDLLRFDRDKIGHVIDPTDPLYCLSGTCTYTIAVFPENIGILEIYLGEHIDFERLHKNEHTVSDEDNLDRIYSRTI